MRISLREYSSITNKRNQKKWKIQIGLRKIKLKLPSNKIYPTGSAPGEFYGTAKIHKLSPNDTINELPLRPIVSNIGTATYHLWKYLAEVLCPLSESEYTIKNTKHFVEKARKNINLMIIY